MTLRTIRRVAMPVVLALAWLLPFPATAEAKHLTGASDWSVTYTTDGRLADNYSESGMEADIRQLQPGDDLTVSVRIRHENEHGADWYVSNEVLKSLEAGDATGSGYGYVLSYEGAKGSTEFYRSATVGGTGSAGLLDATKSLDDYFYLDTLRQGQEGTLRLVVTLDGETEQNAYFNQFARIRLMFAVEEQDTTSGGGTSSERKFVKTGEETNLMPIYAVMIASGLGLLVFIAFDSRRSRREES